MCGQAGPQAGFALRWEGFGAQVEMESALMAGGTEPAELDGSRVLQSLWTSSTYPSPALRWKLGTAEEAMCTWCPPSRPFGQRYSFVLYLCTKTSL